MRRRAARRACRAADGYPGVVSELRPARILRRCFRGGRESLRRIESSVPNGSASGRGSLCLGQQVSVTAWMLATTLTVPRHACPDLDEDAKVSDEIVPGRLAARQAESVLPGAYAVPRA